MNEPDLSSWPTKAAAAAQLKMSVRSLERRISEGAIETQLRPRPEPGKRPEQVCNPADIAALMPAAFVVPASTPAPPASSQELMRGTDQPQAPDALTATLSALLALSARPAAPAEPGPRWLTREAAEKRSGLTALQLRRAIHQKCVTAIGRGQSCRIDSQSLDKFAGFRSQKNSEI